MGGNDALVPEIRMRMSTRVLVLPLNALALAAGVAIEMSEMQTTEKESGRMSYEGRMVKGVDKVVLSDGAAILYNADCRIILPTLGKVDAVVTDPPYNAAKGYGPGNDDLPEEEYAEMMQQITTLAQAIASNQFWVAPRYQMSLWLQLLPGAHIVVIRRGASGPLRHWWSDQFETALAIGRPNRPERDLWDDIRLKGEGYFFTEDTFDHPGYTPYKIMARAVELFSASGQTILDPFMGSGTTGVACARLGRKFIGVEIEDKFFRIACERIKRELDQLKMF